MPESRFKYLYERLGDQEFQQLVGSLLTLRFPDFTPLPVRQADGGRDGKRPGQVYQVKWSVKAQEKNPVAWLRAAIETEQENIRRLASEGVRSYVIATNVPGTGKRRTGSIDKLNDELDKLSKEFGIEMTAMWRESIDSMVTSAPDELLWSYADMLAGWDLVRYLISNTLGRGRDSGIQELVRKFASAQWGEDDRIKFGQVELDRERVTDLFVDVVADRIHSPATDVTPYPSGPIGGAAAYVISESAYPFTLVLGAPGQGKSTLGQFACQAFRAAFLPEVSAPDSAGLVRNPRLPIRFDLGDYAAWMNGYDVFDTSESTVRKKGKARPSTEATIECYIAALMKHLTGGSSVTVESVHELLERIPSLVLLDGLDEVGRVSARRRVVREIGLFCSRGRSYSVQPRVIVTSRPNSSALPVPDPELFETIVLSPMDARLRDAYLKKWCAVHGVSGTDGQTLRRNFGEKTREPYIGELASNPMQLTILLFLLRQYGDATPSQRTELYDAYMNLLLAREANKHPDSVRKHRTELMEIVPFLGWYFQSRSEEQGYVGRMDLGDVQAAMKHFQRTYGKPEGAVDELFEAATDRLWALTSKDEGTFEFEVLSLREYFAAKFLYRYAGEGSPSFDRTIVLRELLRRPFWLNTLRFYGGNAIGSDIYALQAGIFHELLENPTRHVYVAAWNLVTDGVFSSRPIEARAVVDRLTSDLGTKYLLEALDFKEIVPLPDAGQGADAWMRLSTAILADPRAVETRNRVRVLRELFGQRNQFAKWWVDSFVTRTGIHEEVSWLLVAADCEALAGESLDFPGLSASDGQRAQLILNTGGIPVPGSGLEGQLMGAVMDGQCSETNSVRSWVSCVAVALSPRDFFEFGGWSDGSVRTRLRPSTDRRSQALKHLRGPLDDWHRIASLRRFRTGEKNTTYPWANVSTAIFNHVGRCWLASEIAIIGAASSMRNGYTLRPNDEAFGPASHPSAVLAFTRSNKGVSSWWKERLGYCTDELAQAEWALALWAVANHSVVNELIDDLDKVMRGLPARLQRAVEIAAHRLADAGFVKPIRVSLDSRCDVLETLLRYRNIDRTRPSGIVLSSSPISEGDQEPPLAKVARREKWLKVDQTPVYR